MPWRLGYWSVVAATFVIYCTMWIWTLPAIMQGAGGLMAFDLRPTGYTTQEARLFLASLDEAGRAIYLGPQRVLDMFFPPLLAVLLGTGLFVLTPYRTIAWIMLFVALGGMAADFVENARVARMLAHSGEVPEALVLAASRATVVKAILTSVAFIALFAGLGFAGYAKWKAR